MFDPRNPAFIRNPYPVYLQMRELAPVYWHHQLEAWIITSYSVCISVLNEHQKFTADARRVGQTVSPELLSLMSLDPPEQDQPRAVLGMALRDMNQELEGLIRTRARRLLHGLDPPFDFVTAVAVPCALFGITEVMAMPVDEEALTEATYAVVRSMMAGVDPGGVKPGLQARAELSNLIASAYRGSNPGQFLKRVRCQVQEPELDEQIVLNSLRVVLLSGFNSVYKFLGNAVLALVSAGSAWDRVVIEGLTPTAIEEIARYDTPFQVQAKVCTADSTLGDAVISRGDTVQVMFGAANRDPSKFARADELILDRTPNPHLGFGRGVHSCLGRSLSHVVTRAVIEETASLYPSLSVVGDPAYDQNSADRGLRELVVRPA
jgi:cytochrome P450